MLAFNQLTFVHNITLMLLHGHPHLAQKIYPKVAINIGLDFLCYRFLAIQENLYHTNLVYA